MVGGLLDRLNFHCLAPFAASHFSSVPPKSRLSDTLLVIGKGIKEGEQREVTPLVLRLVGRLGKHIPSRLLSRCIVVRITVG